MIITLTDLVIDEIKIDYAQQYAEVGCRLIDGDGNTWKRINAIFWVTMPEQPKDYNGNPLPYPDEWFLLPAGYLPTLINLRNDADTALTAKYLA